MNLDDHNKLALKMLTETPEERAERIEDARQENLREEEDCRGDCAQEMDDKGMNESDFY